MLRHHFQLDRKNPNFLSSFLLYAGATVFISYMSYRVKGGSLSTATWNALFWIIQLFAAVNAVVRSFVLENRGRQYFYYFLASAEAIILSKIIYNTLLLVALAGLNFVLFVAFLGNPVGDIPLFLLALFLGALSFAATLTLLAAIAAKTDNAGTLLAVLGFPLMLPTLLLLIKLSHNALDGLPLAASYDELYVLLALNTIVVSLSWILFPYIWRS